MWVSRRNLSQESIHLSIADAVRGRLGYFSNRHRWWLQQEDDLGPSGSESSHTSVHPLEHHRLPHRRPHAKDLAPGRGGGQYRFCLVRASPHDEVRTIALDSLGFSAVGFALTFGGIRSEIVASCVKGGCLAAHDPTSDDSTI